MLTYIACAKTMASSCSRIMPYSTEPEFHGMTSRLVKWMAGLSAEEVSALLNVGMDIAGDTVMRYRELSRGDAEQMPALFAYAGAVFKRIDPYSLTDAELEYAQRHLRIVSFLYGLLKPLDFISPYRMEGDVRFPGPVFSSGDGPENGLVRVSDFWKPVLTDRFIGDIADCGGVLVDLASEEMKGLFDWKKVESACRMIVRPEFKVLKKGSSKPHTVVIYAKMCRGEMTRHIIRNRIDDPELLKDFEWEGFRFCPDMSTGAVFTFVRKDG